jgi:hypothetical protein
MPDTEDHSKNIVLGWKVTTGLDPRYWLGPRPMPGQQSRDDLVTTNPSAVAHHSVVVAQSGSGKSYFLGRLLEEIAIKTKGRLVIFDPNADFRKIDQIIDKDFWLSKAGYDLETRMGFLPEEPSREDFENKWNMISKDIRTMGKKNNKNYSELQISWPAISIDFLSDESDTAMKRDLSHCHETVRALGQLMALAKTEEWKQKNDLLSESRRFLEKTRDRTESEVLLQLQEDFPAPSETDAPSNTLFKFTILGLPWLNSITSKIRIEGIGALRRKVALSRVFVSKTAEGVYFSNAYAVKGSGLLYEAAQNPTGPQKLPPRIEVIDLPSIREPQYRLLAVSTLLETISLRARDEWQKALDKPSKNDERVPTFIVVDEAHNLVPAEPRNIAERRLREQFRTVAAEGRKFGLFLILVSQRPDKLDALVVSECENRAVMKLGSELVLDKAVELLGLGDLQKRSVEKCLEFETGRVLIAGPWASRGPTFLYSGTRRTEEGGRNLRAAFWTVPSFPAAASPSVPDANKVSAEAVKIDEKVKSESVARVGNGGAKNQSDLSGTTDRVTPKDTGKRVRTKKAAAGDVKPHDA